MAATKLWTRKFILLLLVHLLLNLAFYMIAPILPSFTEKVNAKNVLSMAVVIFIMPSYVARLITGFLCDRCRNKGTKIIGLMAIGLMIISFIGYSEVHNGEQLLLCRALHGISYGMAIPPISGYLARFIPEERSISGHASQSAAGNLGMIIGSVLSLYLDEKKFLGDTFVVGAMAVIIGLILMVFVPVPVSKEKIVSVGKVISVSHQMKTSEVVKKVMPFGLIMCSVLVYSAGVTTYIQKYTNEMGYIGRNSSYMAVNTAVILFSSLIVVWGGKKIGHGRLTVMAFFCFAVGIVGLSIKSLTMFYLAAIANGIGTSFLSAPIRARAMESLPDERRPLGSSVYYTIYDGGASACVLYGMAGDRWGYQQAPLSLSIFVAIGGFLAIQKMRKKNTLLTFG
ncbi:MFS transporter [Shimazuella sp. AN120528]|uniref:MFS transporter n=1 Tax=Shimazuella soli TaxID=1892854 RepID=UPI001F0EB4A9|nr:MFS transporter [Shimazuella soli]MCH5584732.1 MFS transporter [Shimazuella soli]